MTKFDVLFTIVYIMFTMTGLILPKKYIIAKTILLMSSAFLLCGYSTIKLNHRFVSDKENRMVKEYVKNKKDDFDFKKLVDDAQEITISLENFSVQK